MIGNNGDITGSVMQVHVRKLVEARISEDKLIEVKERIGKHRRKTRLDLQMSSCMYFRAPCYIGTPPINNLYLFLAT